VSHTGTELEKAREAATRYAWREAFDLFAAADADEPLGPDDLDAMGECAWWIGKMRHCIALRERAHAAYLKQDDVRRAARIATELSDHHADLMEGGTAIGWIQRAARLLDGQPEGAEHGWLEFGHGLIAHSQGDIVTAQAHAVEAGRLAARHGDRDLLALSLAVEGISEAFSGDPERGVRLVEEASVPAVNGELGPLATGKIYCLMITVNAHVADWQRAGQWTEAATAWCNRQAINGFPGVCRVHRAEIQRLRGALSEAEEEARTATVELGSFNLLFAALAFKELGEVRLKMGEIDAAEDAFRQAAEMGVVPQPGLAQLQVQRGNPKAAAVMLRRALGDGNLRPLDRGKLLPTRVEVALLLGDLDQARAAAAELETIADSHSSPALRAMADAASAAVGLADGTLAPAARAAVNARRLYDEIDLSYESARVSLLLGQIYQAQADAERARTELSLALSTFDAIGAVPDANQARSLLTELPPIG
jgi:tetratricopeptide (TPR) repeat protein